MATAGSLEALRELNRLRVIDALRQRGPPAAARSRAIPGSRGRPSRRSSATCRPESNTYSGTEAGGSGVVLLNVVLVGPSGGGKTTLVEALLVAAGVLVQARLGRRRHDGLRLRRGRDPPAAVGGPCRWRSLSHDGIKVNLIDTPGYADFVGELRAGLRAADCALFVIAANEGVDEPTKSAVAGVQPGRHAARRGDHQARPRPGELRTTRWPRPRMRSATRFYRFICRPVTG